MSSVRTVYSLSEQETFELGRSMGQRLGGGELVLLVGDLGLGKTVFARGLAVGLGVRGEEVSSPSFTLIQEYTGGRLRMYHVDLYRIEESEDLEQLGVDDILASDGVVVVEWGDRLPASQRSGAMLVRFRDLGEDSRQIELRSDDPLLEHADA